MTRFLKTAIISFIILFIGNLFGLKGLYYSFVFYDDILHFLFGALLSLVVFSYLLQSEGKDLVRNKRTLYFTFTFSAVITLGVFWEFFEFLFFPPFQLTLADTLGDLFFEAAGSFLIILCLRTHWFFSKIDSA